MQGQPLYINYGHKSNEELLLGYGFVLSDNKANFVMVTIGTATRDGGTHASLQRSSVSHVGGVKAEHRKDMHAEVVLLATAQEATHELACCCASR